MMQNKCRNEDELYCSINRYDVNDLIENTEENDRSVGSNENNSICGYKIPYLLQDFDSNKEDSEKSSLASYIDDDASTIITKNEEENITEKKKEQIKEKINIIIIQNKGVIKNFEEILSMANVNDENIEKKLNDIFYQICCKNIADINTHNLNKVKDIKYKKGSLNIEHIDYGDIFLTIHDSLRNKKKDNNILHNSYENLRKYEKSLKNKKIKTQYNKNFNKGDYLKFHRKKENIYLSNLNNTIIDKNDSNSCKKKISYYLQKYAKKNIIPEYNSHVIGCDEFILKDRTFLKNFYIKKNRKKDKKPHSHEAYYKETKLSNSIHSEKIEKDVIYNSFNRNSFTEKIRNKTNYFEKEKTEKVNICYSSRNGSKYFLESLPKNVRKDIRLENLKSAKNEKKEKLDLPYSNKNDNNEPLQKKIIDKGEYNENLNHICYNEEVNNITAFNQLDISNSKKKEDKGKSYEENDMHFKEKRKKFEKFDYDKGKDKNSIIVHEDILYDNCNVKVYNALNKLKKIDKCDDKCSYVNEVYVKDGENMFSKNNVENNEEKKLHIDNPSNELSPSSFSNHSKSIISISNLKNMSEKDETYFTNKEDRDYFHFLIKKYEKTKISIDENDKVSQNLIDMQKEEILNVSNDSFNDAKKKEEIVKEKERNDGKKGRENEIRNFRRNDNERYKIEYNEEKGKNEIEKYKINNGEKNEKEFCENKIEENKIEG